tara:strand:+ start:2801 stop:3118 length:318 start_codon:yes stop_codon:yes gene_type:complete
MDLIWFILAAFGLTQILVYGKIFDPIRPTKDPNKMWTVLFHCTMCLGFWVGLFLFFINGFTELFSFDYNVTNALICGCVSSGTSYILGVMFDDDGLKLNFGETND